MGRFFRTRTARRAPSSVFCRDDGLEGFPNAFFAWIALRIASRASILSGWPSGWRSGPLSFLDGGPGSHPGRHLSSISVREEKKGAGKLEIRFGNAETAPSSFKTD